MSNHIEDFRYKMYQECNQHKSCYFCKYKYIDREKIERCFMRELVDYVSYQEERHG